MFSARTTLGKPRRESGHDCHDTQMRALLRPPPPPRPSACAAAVAALRRALSPFVAARQARPARPRGSSAGGAPAWVQQQALLAAPPSAIGMSVRGMLAVKTSLHESMLLEREQRRGGRAALKAEWGCRQLLAWEESGEGYKGERFFTKRDAWRARLEMDAFETMLWRKACRGEA